MLTQRIKKKQKKRINRREHKLPAEPLRKLTLIFTISIEDPYRTINAEGILAFSLTLLRALSPNHPKARAMPLLRSHLINGI